jgi:hypothetical protein
MDYKPVQYIDYRSLFKLLESMDQSSYLDEDWVKAYALALGLSGLISADSIESE